MYTSSPVPIRLGIVGCGAIARIAHLKALAALPQFEVVYLCDRDLEVARLAKTMYGLRAEITTRVDDLRGKVDAAIVCVWPNLHKPIALDLLAMGIDVLCEKPIAGNSADAAVMIEAAEHHQRILAIGHWCRYLQNVWVLRKLLDLQFFGDLCEITAEFGAPFTWPVTTGAYFDRSVTSGGVMFDAGIHVVDLVSWLFGGIGEISFEDDSYGGVETNGVLRGTVTVAGCAVPCRIAASWTHNLRNSIAVVGSEAAGEAQLTEKEMLQVTRIVRGERVRFLVPPQSSTDMPFRSSSPQTALLEDFAESVRWRRTPVTPAEETLAPLKTIETAYSVRRPMGQPWVETGFATACPTNAS